MPGDFFEQTLQQVLRENPLPEEQNERMSDSMRRCITCDYRAEVNAAR